MPVFHISGMDDNIKAFISVQFNQMVDPVQYLTVFAR